MKSRKWLVLAITAIMVLALGLLSAGLLISHTQPHDLAPVRSEAFAVALSDKMA